MLESGECVGGGERGLGNGSVSRGKGFSVT